jgi:hypothetical protein
MSKQIMFWEFLRFIVISGLIYFIPLNIVNIEISFNLIYGKLWVLGLMSCLIFLILDIYIKLNTAIFSKGAKIMDKSEIFL